MGSLYRVLVTSIAMAFALTACTPKSGHNNSVKTTANQNIKQAPEGQGLQVPPTLTPEQAAAQAGQSVADESGDGGQGTSDTTKDTKTKKAADASAADDKAATTETVTVTAVQPAKTVAAVTPTAAKVDPAQVKAQTVLNTSTSTSVIDQKTASILDPTTTQKSMTLQQPASPAASQTMAQIAAKQIASLAVVSKNILTVKTTTIDQVARKVLTDNLKSPTVGIQFNCGGAARDLSADPTYDSRINFLEGSTVLVHQIKGSDTSGTVKPITEFTCPGTQSSTTFQEPTENQGVLAGTLKIGQSVKLTSFNTAYTVTCAKNADDAATNTKVGFVLIPNSGLYTSITEIQTGPHRGARWAMVMCGGVQSSLSSKALKAQSDAKIISDAQKNPVMDVTPMVGP